MFKRNKRLLTCFLTFWITLVQSGIVFAEYEHATHKTNDKCAVCQMADHLAHAVVSEVSLGLNIDCYASIPGENFITFHTISLNLPYLIRGPPLS